MNASAHKKRRRKTRRHEKSIFREFSVEIFIGIMFLFGVFLLFERMEIKSYVFNGIVGLFKTVTTSFSNAISSVLGLTEVFETSDIVGVALIVIAFLLLTVRVRQKTIIRYHDLDSCPECEEDLIHIHRNPLQRLASKIFFLKIRRYKCKSCDFEGFRIRAARTR